MNLNFLAFVLWKVKKVGDPMPIPTLLYSHISEWNFSVDNIIVILVNALQIVMNSGICDLVFLNQ